MRKQRVVNKNSAWSWTSRIFTTLAFGFALGQFPPKVTDSFLRMLIPALLLAAATERHLFRPASVVLTTLAYAIGFVTGDLFEDKIWTVPYFEAFSRQYLFSPTLLHRTFDPVIASFIFFVSLLFFRLVRGPILVWDGMHCPGCRYNLTANESGICPECGSTIPVETN
jgi:hypothetical protein